MDTLRNLRDSGPVVAAALGLLALAPCALADESVGLGIEVSVTADDNVTRGYGSGNILSDQFVGAMVSKSFRAPVSNHARFVLLGFGGFNGYTRFTGLSHAFVGAQGELQYRPSAAFTAPTFGLSVRAAYEEYQSDLRDSYRNTVSLSMRKPVTDRLQLFGALSYNRRDGESVVFDTQDVALRFNLDWALSSRDTIYLGTEYRVGDIVSTGRPSTAYVDLNPEIVTDDVFTDVTRYAYKIDGTTWILGLGYHRSFGERHALDVSWRMANAIPDRPAGASYAATRVHYTVNQFALAYLVRF